MEHTLIILLLIFNTQTFAASNENEKEEFCTNLSCEDNLKINVCGIRYEGEGVRLKLFGSECDLLKFGCQVDSKHAYGVIDMKYCEKSFGNSEEIDDEGPDRYKTNNGNNNHCVEYDCNNPSDDTEVCGVRPDGDGFRVKLFPNKCALLKNNCEENLNFTHTDTFICKGLQNDENTNEVFEETTNEDETIMINTTQTPTDETIIIDTTQTPTDENIMIYTTQTPTNETIIIDTTQSPTDEKIIIDTTQISTEETNTTLAQKLDTSRPKNLFIIDNSLLNYKGNINETMDNFFASTHVNALPVTSLDPLLNETTRRRLIKIAGPVKVFKPWIVIPKNISEDPMHIPTLSSCFHKCPTKCPETYAPICGTPGISAREPSLMFKNHCFMDVAQCKMRWDNKVNKDSSTADSSAYIEYSFMVCLGEELNSLYRFLPLVRSLQRMGRLKKKGYFRYKIRNMKFFNQFLALEPKIMG